MHDRDPQGKPQQVRVRHRLGAIKPDRFISASSSVYGFVPKMLAPDGDPLDVLVCVSEPTFPGSAALAKPIGLLKMSDGKGSDDHVACVPCDDPGWNELTDVNELPSVLRAEISHFFSVYKDLDPTRHSEVKGWGDREAAAVTINEARERYTLHRGALGPPGSS
jgi:inorganic pyrophosphatase